MKLRLPRGLRDVPPREYEKILRLQDTFREVSGRYRFDMMEPSTIEMLRTLELKSGPDIEKEIYAFTDKGGREVALRFDLTVGLTRYVVSNPQLPKPVKLASYSVMWRYDEPQFARYRDFWQWDAEIFGAEPVLSGGEIIAFSEDLLRECGLGEMSTRVSSRTLLDEALEDRIYDVNSAGILRIIDKKDKRGMDVVRELLGEKGLSQEDIAWLSELISLSGQSHTVRDRIEGFDLQLSQSPAFEELSDTVESAKAFGAENVTIDLSVVRGLDYYDGVVFEIQSTEAHEVGSLVGGGSFTSLVQALGGNFTAWGAAGGIERILLALETAGLPEEDHGKRGVFLAYTEESLAPFMSEIAGDLRRSGIPVETSLKGRSLSSQLSHAERSGYRDVLIVGSEEWSKGNVVYRDFVTGEQRDVPREELLRFLQDRQ